MVVHKGNSEVVTSHYFNTSKVPAFDVTYTLVDLDAVYKIVDLE